MRALGESREGVPSGHASLMDSPATTHPDGGTGWVWRSSSPDPQASTCTARLQNQHYIRVVSCQASADRDVRVYVRMDGDQTNPGGLPVHRAFIARSLTFSTDRG